MTKFCAILVSALLMMSTPAYAGVNKTNNAFSADISSMMEKIEKKADKTSQSYKSLLEIKIEFKNTYDNAWKMARYEFYEYASNLYDKINKIASDPGAAKVSKPDWL